LLKKEQTWIQILQATNWSVKRDFPVVEPTHIVSP
jgi:hypothetical protein